MKIGADELILWMRKNNIADHRTTDYLGKQIRLITRDVLGIIDPDDRDVPVKWPTDDKRKVNADKLPKTAAQYDVPDKLLPQLYDELRKIK